MTSNYVFHAVVNEFLISPNLSLSGINQALFNIIGLMIREDYK